METKSFRDELKNIAYNVNTKRSQEWFQKEEEKRGKFNSMLETYFPLLLEKLKAEAQQGYYNYSLSDNDEITPYLKTREFQTVFNEKLQEYNLSLVNAPYNFYIKWD